MGPVVLVLVRSFENLVDEGQLTTPLIVVRLLAVVFRAGQLHGLIGRLLYLNRLEWLLTTNNAWTCMLTLAIVIVQNVVDIE